MKKKIIFGIACAIIGSSSTNIFGSETNRNPMVNFCESLGKPVAVYTSCFAGSMNCTPNSCPPCPPGNQE